MAAQNRSHVPKFGDWDGDNVPYTAYFENARKEKVGGIRINPNDPEENPEAFDIQVHQVGGSNNISPAFARDGPEKYVHQKHMTSYDQRKSSSSHSRVASQSGSDRSSSQNSTSAVVLKPNNESKRSDRDKYTTGSYVPPSPGRNAPSYADDFSCRSVSVPKFGEWDENDPRSAEGFTIIFNKVKEEKQIAASKFPSVPLQKINEYQSSEKRIRSKRCCCLF